MYLKQRLSFIFSTIAEYKRWCFTTALLFILIYYSVLMLSLMIRFGALPNYINVYPWLENIITIVQSTPSLKDTLLIMKDEWLLEIGFMNYDYGVGISEWSLFLAPIKMLGVFVLGMVIAVNLLLMRKTKLCSSALVRNSTKAATGLGASFVALASVTMSWVVCCSTPTWVVGLAMMGLGVSTSLWLEPLGLLVNMIGFILLIFSMLLIAGSEIKQKEMNNGYAMGEICS